MTRLDATVTVDDEEPAARDEAPRPFLFRVLQRDRLSAVVGRHDLSTLDEVALGRAAADDVARRGEQLALAAQDAGMSQRHARLVRDGSRWAVEDLGSKNGVLLNGRRVDRQPLADGDVLELGHTFFRYRELHAQAGASPDIDGGGAAPGLDTLLPQLARRYAQLASVARSSLSVLLVGESGTGKEVLARALHELSRRPGALIAVNCTALPDTLIESELYGFKRGAFSGAAEDRSGLVRASDGGTLFLDEVADATVALQTSFLRVAQEREVLPLGTTRPVGVDLRLVAATQKDVRLLAAEQRFRPDLYARLAGLTVRLDPLRDRVEDLGLLLRVLLERRDARVELTRKAVYTMLRYAWPLNVRELEQAVASALLLRGEGPIDVGHLPESVRAVPARPVPTTGTSAESPSRVELVALLRANGGNVSATARALGKARVQVQRWMKRYAIHADELR